MKRIGVAALSAIALCAAVPGVAGAASRVGVPFPIPNPPPSALDTGTVGVILYNATSSPTSFTFQTDNDKNCSNGNEWIYGSGTLPSGTTEELAPGSSGTMYMWTGACGGNNDDTFTQSTGPGAFSIGVNGGAQFEFSLDVSAGGNFRSVNWDGDYFGPDSAASLNLYNCGNNGVLGNGRGKGATNNSYKFANETQMCFTVCPQGPENDQIVSSCQISNVGKLEKRLRRHRHHKRHGSAGSGARLAEQPHPVGMAG